MATQTKKKYLTSKEVASQLRITNGALQNMRSKGKGPKYKTLERRVLYRQKDVDTWVKEMNVKRQLAPFY